MALIPVTTIRQTDKRSRHHIGTVASDFAFLALAQLLGSAIGFVVLAVVARRIGPANLGAYQFALSIVTYFQIPTNFGLFTLAIRDIARKPDETPRIAGEVLTAQIISTVLMFALLLVVRPALTSNVKTFDLLPIVGLFLLLQGINFEWLLMSQRRMKEVAASRIIGQVAYGIATPVLLVGGFEGARIYAGMNAVGAAISAIIVVVLARKTLASCRFRVSVKSLVIRLRRGLPLGLSTVMLVVYYSTDAVILGYLTSSNTVGQYAVALKVPQVVTALVISWITAWFPYAARAAALDDRQLREDLVRVVKITVAVAAPAALGSIVVGTRLMVTLFGPQFAAAGAPFRILMLSVAFVMLSGTLSQMLVASGEERFYAFAITLGVLVNAVLDLVLIPLTGASGAATATLIVEFFLLIGFGLRLRSLIGTTSVELGLLGRVSIACALMVLTLILLRFQLPVIPLIGVGIATYSLACIALGLISLQGVRRTIPLRVSRDSADTS